MMGRQYQPSVWFPAIRTGTGSDTFTKVLCGALVERGFRAEISWIPHYGEFLPWLVKRPVAPAWANIAHVNSWLPPRLLPTSIPVVSTVHHCVHDPALRADKGLARTLYHRYWIRSVEQANLRVARLRLAVSDYTSRSTTRHLGIDNLQTIYNGIDARVFTPGDATLSVRRPNRILVVGTWSYRKGSDLLAPIMAALGPDYQLRHTQHRDTAAKWGLTGNAHALGHIDQATLVDELRSADVLLMPSRLEGFGLAAVEAMACGTPVVATRGTSLTEVITHGQNGLLCEPNDVSGFAAAIRNLCTDQAMNWRTGQAAVATARDHFDIDRCVAEHIEAYRTLLEGQA